MKINSLRCTTLLVLLLSIWGCTAEDREAILSDNEAAPTASTEPVLISVTTNAKQEVDALMLSLDIDLEGEDLRANKYEEDEATTTLKKSDVRAEETAHCIIRKKGDRSATIYADITWKGRSGNRLKLEKVRLPSDKKIDRAGQWYITAIIGGKSFDLSNGQLRMGEAGSEPTSLPADGSLDAPYILAWTRLELPANSQTALIPAAARFRPHGTILRLQFNSDMAQDYKAIGLKISTNAWRDTGVFDPMAIEDDALDSPNQLPQWRADVTNTDIVERRFTLAPAGASTNHSLVLPAGAGWSAERTIYTWGMPTNVEQPNLSTKIELEVEALETPQAGEINVAQHVVTYDKQRHRPLKIGSTYKLSNILTSGLIISEVFYDYAREENPSQPQNRNNYSIVEIYNPTTSPIDLAEYALARAINSYSEGYTFYVANTPRGQNNPNTALLLPLSIISGDAPNKVPFGGNVGQNYPRMGEYEGAWFHRFLGSRSTILEPGKTVLIAGPGYAKTRKSPKSSIDAFDRAVQQGTLPADLFTGNSTSDPKYRSLKQAVQDLEDAQATNPRAGGQIDSAFSRGYTQAFVAADNGITHEGGNRWPAVLDLAPTDGLVLVRYNSDNRSPEVVDAAVPVLQGRAVASSFNQLRSTSLNQGLELEDHIQDLDADSDLPYSLVRSRGYNFSTAQMITKVGAWHFERSENGGRKSLGSRNYVAGRSPYASAWAGYTQLNNPKNLPFWREVSGVNIVPERGWSSTSEAQASGVYNDGFDRKQSAIKQQNKIKVARAKASSEHAHSKISNAIDGNTNGTTDATIYHSRWGRNDLPIELDFIFEQTEQVGSITYYPRQGGNDNGNFQEVEILYSNDGQNYTSLQRHTFNGTKAMQELALKQVVTAGAIRIKVLSGVGGYASASEVEFYRSGYNPRAYEQLMADLFSDKACTVLRPNLSREQILQHSDPFLKDIALRMYDRKYPREFRIDDFEAYPDPWIQANELKTYPHSVHDNPTGIAVKKDEVLVVFVGDTHGHSGLQLRIQNLDKPNSDGFGGAMYPLKEGFNAIKVREKGLIYVNYLTSTMQALSTAKPITIHFATGTVNGYFDSQRESHRGRWLELLSRATDRYFDIIGAHAHMTYETRVFRGLTPDGKALADVADKIVVAEMEHLGLYKYDRVRKNRSYMHVMYHAFMYATHHHTAYVHTTMETLASAQKMESAWGPYHEIGHTNQTQGLKWKGMTECTVNIFSFYVMYNVFKKQTRMMNENRYHEAWNGLLRRNIKSLSDQEPNKVVPSDSHASKTTKVFGKLVPFVQLELYFGNVLGKTPAIQTSDKGGFYPDLYEYLRVHATNDATKRAPGYEQSEFALIASKVAGYDLTDFFDKWGFLTPVDMEIDDYGKGRLTVTEQRGQEVREQIKALRKPKLNVALEYITENNLDLYRNPQPMTVGTIIRNNRQISTQGFSHVVAYEVADAGGEILHIEYGDKTSWTLPASMTWTASHRIIAVDATGKRTRLSVS